MSATEKLAGISDAIVYKSSGTSDSRGTKCLRCERLPGGCPADSTRCNQTLSDSVHVVDGRIPTAGGLGLALDHRSCLVTSSGGSTGRALRSPREGLFRLVIGQIERAPLESG